MKSIHSFTAYVDGIAYEVSTTMNALIRASVLCGLSPMESQFTGRRAEFLRALIVIGMEDAGVTMTLEQVGELCGLTETLKNELAFTQACSVDRVPRKNAKTEGPRKSRTSSPGHTSSDTPMASSE